MGFVFAVRGCCAFGRARTRDAIEIAERLALRGRCAVVFGFVLANRAVATASIACLGRDPLPYRNPRRARSGLRNGERRALREITEEARLARFRFGLRRAAKSPHERRSTAGIFGERSAHPLASRASVTTRDRRTSWRRSTLPRGAIPSAKVTCPRLARSLCASKESTARAFRARPPRVATRAVRDPKEADRKLRHTLRHERTHRVLVTLLRTPRSFTRRAFENSRSRSTRRKRARRRLHDQIARDLTTRHERQAHWTIRHAERKWKLRDERDARAHVRSRQGSFSSSERHARRDRHVNVSALP